MGYLARSPYEYSHHLKFGREFGYQMTIFERLLRKPPAGKPNSHHSRRRCCARHANKVDLTVTDETFAAVAELDNERLVDLVMTIAVYNGVVRLLATLQIDVEPEYQHYLDEFPLPKE